MKGSYRTYMSLVCVLVVIALSQFVHGFPAGPGPSNPRDGNGQPANTDLQTQKNTEPLNGTGGAANQPTSTPAASTVVQNLTEGSSPAADPSKIPTQENSKLSTEQSLTPPNQPTTPQKTTIKSPITSPPTTNPSTEKSITTKPPTTAPPTTKPPTTTLTTQATTTQATTTTTTQPKTETTEQPSTKQMSQKTAEPTEPPTTLRKTAAPVKSSSHPTKASTTVESMEPGTSVSNDSIIPGIGKNSFTAKVLLPVIAGIILALFIVLIAWSVRSCINKNGNGSKRRLMDHDMAPTDRVMLLAESSEDEF